MWIYFTVIKAKVITNERNITVESNDKVKNNVTFTASCLPYEIYWLKKVLKCIEI